MADLSTITLVAPLTFLVMPGATLPAGLRTSKLSDPSTSTVILMSWLPSPASFPATVRVLVAGLKAAVGSPTRWMLAGTARSSSTSSQGRWLGERLAAGAAFLRGARTAFRQDLNRRDTMAHASKGGGLRADRNGSPSRADRRRGAGD